MTASSDLRALIVATARVEDKLNVFAAGAADREARLRQLESYDMGSHGRRIAALERWRWLVTGMAGSLGAGAGSLVTLLLKH